jgi:hypothetical protein
LLDKIKRRTLGGKERPRGTFDFGYILTGFNRYPPSFACSVISKSGSVRVKADNPTIKPAITPGARARNRAFAFASAGMRIPTSHHAHGQDLP